MKLKGSEISAIIEIDPCDRSRVHPFFDFPRRDEKKTRDTLAEIKSKEENFLSALTKTSSRMKKRLPEISSFYLDNFDLEDDLLPNGKNTYEQIIEKFGSLGMIPVVGLDRAADHFNAIMGALVSGEFQHDRIALRLTEDDFNSFELIEDELTEIFENCLNSFKEIDVVFDCRVMKEGDEVKLSSKIVDFIKKLDDTFYIDRVIVTGSTIPASISNILGTKEDKAFARPECSLYDRIIAEYNFTPLLYMGDYTCVSPEYSDTDFYVEDMQNITTAKLMYPYSDKYDLEQQYILRGSRVKTDKTQYGRLALMITNNSKNFYREANFSFGDRFIYQCAENIKTNATPSSIVKPLINLHLEYMINK